MKAIILTNIKIEKEWIDELRIYVDWDIEIIKTRKRFVAKWNPFFSEYWGDFDWIRKQIPNGDIRCFVTTQTRLNNLGIRHKIGLYDLTDGDSKLDFYFGMPSKLDKRAKANGFKSNFAWGVIHEYLHGEEQQSKKIDRVHVMETQGRLIELLTEYNKKRKTLVAQITLIQKFLKWYNSNI